MRSEECWNLAAFEYSQIIAARDWQGLGLGWATEPTIYLSASLSPGPFHDLIVDRIKTCVISNVTKRRSSARPLTA